MGRPRPLCRGPPNRMITLIHTGANHCSTEVNGARSLSHLRRVAGRPEEVDNLHIRQRKKKLGRVMMSADGASGWGIAVGLRCAALRRLSNHVITPSQIRNR